MMKLNGNTLFFFWLFINTFTSSLARSASDHDEDTERKEDVLVPALGSHSDTILGGKRHCVFSPRISHLRAHVTNH